MEKRFAGGDSYDDNLNEAKTGFHRAQCFRNSFNPAFLRNIRTRSFCSWRIFIPICRPRWVRRSMKGVGLTGGDTMNYWINRTRKELIETLKLVDVLLINDTEAKALGGETNLPRAAAEGAGSGTTGAG